MSQLNYDRTTDLYKALLIFSELVIKKANEYKESNKLIAIPYQSLPVKEIDYLMESYYYDWDKLEYFDYYEWKSEDFNNLIDQEIKNSREIEVAANEILKSFDIPEKAKKMGLISFTQTILRSAPNGQISSHNIDTYIQLFINEYVLETTKQPLIWNVHLWLANIYIESSEIEIAPNVFLRRPNQEQLREVKEKPNYIHEWDYMLGKQLVSGAILTFSVLAGRKTTNGLVS